jgi:hypothetical protein
MQNTVNSLRKRLGQIEKDIMSSQQTSIANSGAIDKVHADLNQISHDFDEIWFGNGKPGIKLQVDRLENSMSTIKWGVAVIIVGIIGQLVASLWKILVP